MDEIDCSENCRSTQHGYEVIAKVTQRLPFNEIQQELKCICKNFHSVTDAFGRCALHFAASTGQYKLLNWLIENFKVNLELKDFESNWTALHRSLFYQELSSAFNLINHNASVQAVDFNGYTPFDILISDRLPYISYEKSDRCEIYIWGSNDNLNLGLDKEGSRKYPDCLPFFNRNRVFIKQVVICKFHSTFLTYNGFVYTCGHGHGGRLGNDQENTAMIPELITDLKNIAEIASGQDHVLALKENGKQLYSFGLNTYHQLGHSPPPDRLLQPRQINLKVLKNDSIVGIGAARYHSFFYTKDKLFTWGLNAGQLGHSKGERTQITPRSVPSIKNAEDIHLSHVASSDGAIVLLYTNGDIYVQHQYQSRKIISAFGNVKEIQVIGGHLDERLDVSGVYSGGGQELVILILTKSGHIYAWKENDSSVIRCLIKYNHELTIKDICLNQSNILMVSEQGEAFKGILHPRNHRRQSESTKCSNTIFTKLSEGNNYHQIKVERIPFVHRAVSINSDYRNQNFAILQSSPKLGLLETINLKINEMSGDFRILLETSGSNDLIHDVIIQNGCNRRYYAHKYILASRSDYFRKYFSNNQCNAAGNGSVVINIDESISSPEIFDQIMQFIYTNSADILINNKKLNWPKLSSVNSYVDNKKDKQARKTKAAFKPIDEMKKVSKKFGIEILTKILSNDQIKINGNVVKIDDFLDIPLLKFDREQLTHLSDITIRSSDDINFHCHRCILVARSDYFRSMLLFDWIESKLKLPLPLPLPGFLLEILFEYLYTNESQILSKYEDPEKIFQCLIMADQYLVPNLKLICESSLVEILSLKNVCELLELSYVYSAVELRRCCQNFICINLTAIIEHNYFTVLSENTINELSSYYKQINRDARMYQCPREIRPYQQKQTNEIDFSSYLEVSNDNTVYEQTNRSVYKATKQRNSNKKNRKKISNEITENTKLIDTDKKIFSKQTDNIVQHSISSASQLTETSLIEENNNHIINTKDLNNDCNNNNSKDKETIKKPLGWRVDMKREPMPVTMLKDIFNEQNELKNKTNKTSIPNNINVYRSKPIPIKKASIERLSLDEIKDYRPEASSSAGMITTSAWNTIEQTTPVSSYKEIVYGSPDSLTMNEIIEEEERKEMKMKTPKMKPLYLIAQEDKAIEELLIFYKENESSYEKISVERVVSENFGIPNWRKA